MIRFCEVWNIGIIEVIATEGMTRVERGGDAVAVAKGVLIEKILNIVFLVKPELMSGSVSLELKTNEQGNRT